MHKTEESVKKAKELMEAGKIAEAIRHLDDSLGTPELSQADELYYLRGNKATGKWRLTAIWRPLRSIPRVRQFMPGP